MSIACLLVNCGQDEYKKLDENKKKLLMDKILAILQYIFKCYYLLYYCANDAIVNPITPNCIYIDLDYTTITSGKLS